MHTKLHVVMLFFSLIAVVTAIFLIGITYSKNKIKNMDKSTHFADITYSCKLSAESKPFTPFLKVTSRKNDRKICVSKQQSQKHEDYESYMYA